MQSSSTYMCVASEKIMHFASGRLGIHGYCKEFPKKRRLEYSRHTRLTGLHMETDIWIKGTDIIASHRDTGRIRMGCLHLKASGVGYSTKERKWGEETRPVFPTWGAATPVIIFFWLQISYLVINVPINQGLFINQTTGKKLQRKTSGIWHCVPEFTPKWPNGLGGEAEPVNRFTSLWSRA